MDVFRKSPPVSRTYAACVFVVSMARVCMIVEGSRLEFEWNLILKSFPEVWRFFTSFMLTFQLSIIFTPYTIWNFGGALERDCVRMRSASFLVYLFFVGSIILALNKAIWGWSLYTDPMVLAIVWTYAQNNRGTNTNIMGINIPVMYLPAAMLFMTLIIHGPIFAMMEATGIPAAHLWEFLTYYWPTYGGGVNLVPTPQFLIKWFHAEDERNARRGWGANVRATPETANSAFVNANTWGTRGAGRRLGDS